MTLISGSLVPDTSKDDIPARLFQLDSFFVAKSVERYARGL